MIAVLICAVWMGAAPAHSSVEPALAAMSVISRRRRNR